MLAPFCAVVAGVCMCFYRQGKKNHISYKMRRACCRRGRIGSRRPGGGPEPPACDLLAAEVETRGRPDLQRARRGGRLRRGLAGKWPCCRAATCCASFRPRTFEWRNSNGCLAGGAEGCSRSSAGRHDQGSGAAATTAAAAAAVGRWLVTHRKQRRQQGEEQGEEEHRALGAAEQ